MSGAQGKVKLIRNQQSSSRVNSKGYPYKTTAATSLKQPRRNLAEKRLLSLRNKLKESPPEASSTKELKKPVKRGGKRKPSEDDVGDKAKKVKPNLECDRQKGSSSASLNVQKRLEKLKHLMGSPLKKDTQKIPKIKKVKCSVEDHTDDETLIEDDSLEKSVNTSHSFTVVSEATISDKSPLKQRLKRTRSGLQSVDSITPSKKDCSSTIKSSQSSQCTLTPVKVPQCSSSSSAPKSKLSERLARIRNSKVELPRSPLVPKFVEISNWIESTQPPACSSDVSISNSLIVNTSVNTDTSLLQNSMVMTEVQDDDSMEWDACPEVDTQPVDSQPKITAIVTDTNVFMHDLTKIRELLEFKGNQNVLLYIPFMVLQELDYIKDHNGPYQKCQALAAQRLINKYLASSSSRLVGQTVDEACNQQNLGKSPDDKILSCCLQAQTKYPTVILLSNDINLRNKALANNIQAFNSTDCLRHVKFTVYQPIVQPLEDLLSKIILHCCQQMFGSTTKYIEMLQGSPWTFKGCLERIKKYWSTVFRELLLKQCLKTVEELMVLLEKGGSDGDQVKKFKSKVKELLFYLQDIAEFSSVIKKVRDDL